MTETHVLLLRKLFCGSMCLGGTDALAAKELSVLGLVDLSKHPTHPVARLTSLGRLLMSPPTKDVIDVSWRSKLDGNP
jgi:hypothetical protein